MTILVGLSGVAAAVFHVVQLFFALLAAFFFVALVFSHFFVGDLVVLARGEHRSAASVAREVGIALLPFARAEASDAADRLGDGASLDEKFADLFKEIVKMVWLQRVWKAFALQDGLRVLRSSNRNQEQRTNAFGLRLALGWLGGRLGFGELLEYGEKRSANVGQRDIDDGEIPRPRGQFGKGVSYQRNDADAPALGIEDVFQRTLAGDIVVNNQDSYIRHGWVSAGSPIKYIGGKEGRNEGLEGDFQGRSCTIEQAKQKRKIVLDIANKRRI